jgi:hypothetical protein
MICSVIFFWKIFDISNDAYGKRARGKSCSVRHAGLLIGNGASTVVQPPSLRIVVVKSGAVYLHF